jgi:putative tryptophan/tyrosine transport system substrate-binding protein
MRRRQFIGLMGSAAAIPFAVRAQKADGVRRIGVLLLGSPDPTLFLQELRNGLQKFGHIENRDFQLEVRSAGANPSALADAAGDLVRLKVDIIVAWLTPAATAAKQATVDIPIVMTAGNPVETGLVTSLARPGGNVTGMDVFGAQLGSKCVELVRDTLPSVRRVALLANVADPFTGFFVAEIKKAASSIGIATEPFMLNPTDEFSAAFAEMRERGAEAVVMQPTLIKPGAIELAMKHRLPSFSIVRGFPTAGGLMSFSANFIQLIHDLTGYVDRIFRGNKPADLPVMQPTRFELVINLKTAKAIGLDVPPMLLARADEVIE